MDGVVVEMALVTYKVISMVTINKVLTNLGRALGVTVGMSVDTVITYLMR